MLVELEIIGAATAAMGVSGPCSVAVELSGPAKVTCVVQEE